MAKNIIPRIPNPSSKLKKGKSQYNFQPIQNALPPPDLDSFGDTFMNVLDYLKLSMSKERYMDVHSGLVDWGSQMYYAIQENDKAKYEQFAEEFSFRLKLIAPVNKYDLIKPKFDEVLELGLKIF